MAKKIYFTLNIIIISAIISSCAGIGKKTEVAPAADTPLCLANFSADSAYTIIDRQLRFGSRVPGTDAHRQCGDYLTATLSSLGADTIINQTATISDNKGSTIPVRNIFARFNTKAPRHILLAAHWDSRPWADNDSDPANHNQPIPGANDGASGVAVILEIARLISLNTPQIGVDILLTDAEDSGVDDNDTSWGLGAQYFADHLPYTTSDRPDYAILLDMVGDHAARFKREYVSEYFARPVNDRIQAIAKASGYSDIFIDEIGGAVTDDHTFLNQAGIPTADIIDCNNALTGTFPATWHTMADDLPAISPKTLKAVGQTVTNIIYSEQK